MLDICLLGCAGKVPSKSKALSSAILRYRGHNILFDCGEGTQIEVTRNHFNLRKIDIILLTHYHTDHISGLPGLLTTISGMHRTKPITIIGPPGLHDVMKGVRLIAQGITTPINLIELQSKHQAITLGDFVITATKVFHNVICYAYSVQVAAIPRCRMDMLEKYGLPGFLISKLKKGKSVIWNNNTIKPEMILEDCEKKFIKITFCTDTRPGPNITKLAQNSDVFICEGMYPDNSFLRLAEKYKHMIFEEAVTLAVESSSKELWLTHFSPTILTSEFSIEHLQKRYQNIIIGKDGLYKTLRFREV